MKRNITSLQALCISLCLCKSLLWIWGFKTWAAPLLAMVPYPLARLSELDYEMKLLCKYYTPTFFWQWIIHYCMGVEFMLRYLLWFLRGKRLL